MNNSSYEETGVLTPELLKLPSKERLERGPVVIIECVQSIPCDPCVYACKYGAIEKESLTAPPKVNYEKCVGCGECVSECPGLAIFVVNMNFSGDEATITIPYEFLPLPKRGEIYEALDREGKIVGQARVIAVRLKENKTHLVTIAVKKSLAMVVRNIGRRL
jgi:Fe-S-cluster-containing hydrogenase component 2